MIVQVIRDELWPYYEVDDVSTLRLSSKVEDLPEEFLERYRKACKEFFECQGILQEAYGVK